MEKCPYDCPEHEPDDLFCARCGKPLSASSGEAAAREMVSPTLALAPVVSPVVADAVPSTPEPGSDVSVDPVPAPIPPALASGRRQRFVPTACPHCGTSPGQFDEDGFCTTCWAQVLLAQRDDFLIKIGPKLAARSSIGNGSRHAHSRNEDFAALDVVEVDGKPVILAAVADGLTTCTNPPRASEVACKVAIEKLRVGALGGEKDSAKLVQVAMEAAQAAVIAVMPEPGADSESLPPSAAIVMAYIKNDEAYLGWCGDSRIYAIERNADGAYAVQQLTRDHTMLNEMVDSGQMTVAEACARLTVHELHTMVQCLGEVPEGDVFAPSYRVVKIEPSMVGLFLATDGAWNDEHPMDARESALFPEDYAATAGNALAFAEKVLKRASGEDNVTIAVILF